MKATAEAHEIMRWLTERYVAAKFPNYKVWTFSPAEGDTVFPELRALGLIEQTGSRRSSFRLTNAGHRWVMESRTVKPSRAVDVASGDDARGDQTEQERPMYNLLVTAEPDAWKKPAYILDFSRYLEHTDSDLSERLKSFDSAVVAELTKLPTLFAYETEVGAPARVGWIAELQRRDDALRITPRFDEKVDPVSCERIESLKWELQIGDWEMSRTHWAVKAVDLFGVVQGREGALSAVPPYVVAAPQQAPRLLGDRVFIVHGRQDGAKHDVARFLEQIGVEPIILHERPNGGRTLIAKFQEESSGISFAVVLMTADDVGGLVGENQKARARQNVIFELGFFIGKLGASKVCALVSGDIEKPSDFDAIVYVQYGTNLGWKTELARELRQAGIRFDANRVF